MRWRQGVGALLAQEDDPEWCRFEGQERQKVNLPQNSTSGKMHYLCVQCVGFSFSVLISMVATRAGQLRPQCISGSNIRSTI